MRIARLLLVLLLAVTPLAHPALVRGTAPPAWRADVQAMLDAVSTAALIQHICKLQDDDAYAYCNDLGTRYSFSGEGLAEAAQYLRDAYSALGLQVTDDEFEYGSARLANLVAELPGSDPAVPVIVLCAHYDSFSRSPYTQAPGADDNASGSAAVLEAARVLSRYRFLCTIRFVHFAAEEQGMIGSHHYAEQAFLRGDDILAVINLDMIGYESPPYTDHAIEIHARPDNPDSVTIADLMIACISTYGLALAPQRITAGATDRSDHSSFWSYGYPAVMASEDFDDFNLYYHSVNDTLAHLHMPLVTEFTRAAVATIAELAGTSVTPTPEPPLHRLWFPIVRNERAD